MFIFKEHKNINGEGFNTEQMGNGIFTENRNAEHISNLHWDQHVMQMQYIALPCIQKLSFAGLQGYMLLYFLYTFWILPTIKEDKRSFKNLNIQVLQGTLSYPYKLLTNYTRYTILEKSHLSKKNHASGKKNLVLESCSIFIDNFHT